jgi:hypothetical protein
MATPQTAPDSGVSTVIVGWEADRAVASAGSTANQGAVHGGPQVDRAVAHRFGPSAGGIIAGMDTDRDRDAAGRARQARPRDRLGRPLAYGNVGVEPVSEDPLPPGPTIEVARALLAEGRPFSAHEVFEARWKDAPTGERDLWQGLAQLCVGSTHRERGNGRGARTLWQRALGRLTTYAATDQPTYGLDLGAITEWLTRRLAELVDESGPAVPPGLPPL